MSDEAADTTPLVASSPTSAGELATSLKWYSYLCIVLLTINVIGVFVHSFSSFWTFLFINGTILLLIHLYLRFIYPLKPAIVKLPFLITHVTFGFIVYPLLLIAMFIFIFIAVGIIDGIVTTLIGSIFFSVYPEAGKVFSEDLEAMSDAANGHYPHYSGYSLNHMFSTLSRHSTKIVHTYRFASKTMPQLPNLIYRMIISAKNDITNHHVTEMTDKVGLAFSKVWNDMVNAGASPMWMGITLGLVIFITVILFVVVGGLLCTGSLEYLKWRLFMRYKKIPSLESISSHLGAKGLVFVAITGAYAFVMASIFNASFQIAHTFYSGLILMCTYFIDAVIIVGSQLLVATFYIQKELYGQPVTMKDAFKKSILFNFLLVFLRVTPPVANQPDVTPPIILFLIFIALRGVLALKFSKSFYDKYQSICDEPVEAA